MPSLRDLYSSNDEVPAPKLEVSPIPVPIRAPAPKPKKPRRQPKPRTGIALTDLDNYYIREALINYCKTYAINAKRNPNGKNARDIKYVREVLLKKINL